jgi:DNA-binding IclR family transcriptional regulator
VPVRDPHAGLIGAVAVSARPDRLTGQDATVEAKLRNVAGRVSRLLHGAHPR